MAAFPERRLSIITIGVRDRAALTGFYETVLGFKNVGPEGMSMFDMGGFILGLWEEDRLADDAGLPNNRTGDFKALALAYNARSIDEVDGIFADLASAGVTITAPPHKAFWGGYSGYFTDPEGNAWEVAYNPFWTLDEAGRVVLPSTEDV
ncbi:VOC family protein [Hyphomonas sp.]|uniref:VOC family protein n=1 Tax=Hyphomonas sp. TaxID=87 RepID=UPI0032EFDA84|tara:strand:- start:22612 stop:23061 length:450 start_codon:yes stop_codon:yes gene_type:complete